MEFPDYSSGRVKQHNDVICLLDPESFQNHIRLPESFPLSCHSNTSDQIIIIVLLWSCKRAWIRAVVEEIEAFRNADQKQPNKENWKRGNRPAGYKRRTDFLQLHDWVVKFRRRKQKKQAAVRSPQS